MDQIRFLECQEVVILHHQLILLFGGTTGLRDEGLLESALSQPQAGFGNTYFHKSIFEMAAAYLFHIAKNHPFIDGNKRIALACADTFLRLNGFDLQMPPDACYELTMKVASEGMAKQGIAADLERHCQPISPAP